MKPPTVTVIKMMCIHQWQERNCSVVKWLRPQQIYMFCPPRCLGYSSSIFTQRASNVDPRWIILVYIEQWSNFWSAEGQRARENTDPTKCNFFTPPVTSTCFVNLVLTLPPWGLSIETWCVAAPTPVALTAEACKSSLHISYNKISCKFRRLGVRRKQFRAYLSWTGLWLITDSSKMMYFTKYHVDKPSITWIYKQGCLLFATVKRNAIMAQQFPIVVTHSFTQETHPSNSIKYWYCLTYASK